MAHADGENGFTPNTVLRWKDSADYQQQLGTRSGGCDSDSTAASNETEQASIDKLSGTGGFWFSVTALTASP